MMLLKMKWVNLVMFMILLQSSLSYATIYEMNKDNLEEFRKDKLMVVIFVDSPTCERCRILFPFFVAASQTFPSDPEIFFVRVHDKRLIKEWGIAELPALMYYRRGIEEPDFFSVDITVDDIIDEIARRLHGNFGSLNRYYAVEINPDNFQEIVKTPKQSVLLLAYDKTTKQEVKVMEQVAKVFRNDEAILICKLNVDKEKELRDREYKSRDVPAVFWYKVGDKKIPKRFGGHISIYMQTTFINEQTGLNRNHDGSLKSDSGRIEGYDTIVLENADDLLARKEEAFKRVAEAMRKDKALLQSQEVPFADYYLFLLEKMGATGSFDIVQTQLDDIGRKLDEHEDMLAKQEDFLKRKRNVLHFFLDLETENVKFKEERFRKEEQKRLMMEVELMEREEAERRKGPKTEYTAKATLHRRVHEEL